MPRGAPKGVRYGGRVKGTPNKATIDARETLERLGLNPLEGMAKLALDESNPVELRGRMMSELAQYIAPKRKAVEHSGGTEDLLTVEVLKFTAGQK
jgi:hypothetical protein